MSWQSYVDDHLIGSGHVSKALICDATDGVLMATNGFKGDGTKDLVNLFKNPSDALTNGITIDGDKFTVFKADSHEMNGRRGVTGIVCIKTNQYIVVGFYDEKGVPGTAKATCEKLANYLVTSGY